MTSLAPGAYAAAAETPGEESATTEQPAPAPEPSGQTTETAPAEPPPEQAATEAAPADATVAEPPAEQSPEPAPTEQSPQPAPTEQSPQPAPAEESPEPAPVEESPEPEPAPAEESPEPAPAEESPAPEPAPAAETAEAPPADPPSEPVPQPETTEPATTQQAAAAAVVDAVEEQPALVEQQAVDEGGQQLEVEIEDVVVGDPLADGRHPVTVTGQASIGPLVLDVSGLYVVDVSGSTSSGAGDCDGDGTQGPGDDVNGDGRAGTVLDCEVAGALSLNGSFLDTTANVGVVPFSTTAEGRDVDPAAEGVQFFTTPRADRDGDGTRDVEQVLLGLQSGGGTAFDQALAAMNEVFADRPEGTRSIAFFLSDGSSPLSTSEGSALAAAAAAGTQVNTFSVGGGAAGCEQGEPLRTIADATGGRCTRVEDPTTLSAVLGDLAPVGIDRVTVRLGDGDPVRAMLDPFGNFSADLFGSLLPGQRTITVTAFDEQGGTAVATRALPSVQPPAVEEPAAPAGDAAPPAAGETASPPPSTAGTGVPPAGQEGDGAEGDDTSGVAGRTTEDEQPGQDDEGTTGGDPGGPGTTGTAGPATTDGPGAAGVGDAEVGDAGEGDAGDGAGDLVPELGESVVLRVLSGTVFVRLPSGELLRVTGPVEVPVGSSIDTRRGEVALSSVRDTSGAIQTGNFRDGIFLVEQREQDAWVTELRLKGGDLPPAGTEPVSHGGDEHECRAERRRLWGDAPDRSRFRTRGRFSSAAVRGTEWLTQDCRNGTVTSVREGRVTVRDLVRDVIEVLGAGDSYLARDDEGDGAAAADRRPERSRL